MASVSLGHSQILAIKFLPISVTKRKESGKKERKEEGRKEGRNKERINE
jgi:hypothetical protein